MAKFEELFGKTLVCCTTVSGVEHPRSCMPNHDGKIIEIHFETGDGEHYKLYHIQLCCESVTVESIVGDLQDLIGSPITRAEEAVSEKPADEDARVQQGYLPSPSWTFYKLGTVRGSVDIRWYAASNFYSERVDFVKVMH